MPVVGWCHEFGVRVEQSCGHPMQARRDHCGCAACGAVCPGRFDGCTTVWERGPREVALRPPTGNGSSAGRAEPAGRHPVPAAPTAGATPAPPAAARPAGDTAERLADRELAEQTRHVAEQPGHVAEQPGHVAEQPGHVAEQPGHVAEQPGHLVEQLWAEVAELRRVTASQQEALASQQHLLANQQDALERQHTLLAGLQQSLSRQRDEVAAVGDAVAELRTAREEAERRLAELAERLPQRLGQAIASAIEMRQDAYLARVDDVLAALGDAAGGGTPPPGRPAR